MHEQKGNIIQEMGYIKNNKVEMLEMENMVKEMKNVCNRPISRLNAAMERTNKLKARSIKLPNQKYKERMKKQNGASRSCGTVSSSLRYM